MTPPDDRPDISAVSRTYQMDVYAMICSPPGDFSPFDIYNKIAYLQLAKTQSI